MTTSPTIPGLIKTADAFHHAIHVEVGQTDQNLSALSDSLEKTCQRIDKRLEKLGIQPGNLPTRTMYAAIWFLFLRQKDHFAQHVQQVTKLQTRFCQEIKLHHNPPTIKLAPSSFLFKMIPRPHTFTLLLHEGFLYAPDTILKKLVQLAGKDGRKKRLFGQLKAFSKTSPYQEVVQTLNGLAKAIYYEPDAAGTHYHLKDSFQRVNWAYFQGEQSLPHLQWSKRSTTRKLGHYNPIPDTIQVSRTLDQISVPEYVLDYVMYHEMVHRTLGIAEVNGRKSSHNAAFHQMEKEYAHLEQAKQFLQSSPLIEKR